MEEMEAESAAASMVTVDRAMSDLRRGDFVMLESGAGVALAQAAETVTAASLATFTRLASGRASLALTARRASVLAFPRPAAAGRHGSGVITLPLAGIGDPETIRWLIDPTALRQGPLPQSVAPRQESGESFAAAAVTLSKLAQLLPAALTATLPPGAMAPGWSPCRSPGSAIPRPSAG